MTHSDHGIVKKGQEQPVDKQRAQTAHTTGPDGSVTREATRDRSWATPARQVSHATPDSPSEHRPGAVAGARNIQPRRWLDLSKPNKEAAMAMAMATDQKEFGNLIGSDKVEGTAVYGPDESKIGSIERVMIDKLSGKVSYAVLGFGGFLGVGNDHYPLPWQSLKYDTNLGGYRTGITENQLRGAPKYASETDWNWADAGRTRSLNDYYGVPVV